MNIRWEFPFFITVKDKGGCHTVNCFSIKIVKFDKFCFNALHIRREIVHTAGREERRGRFIIWRDTNFIRSLVSDPTQLGAGRRHELDRTQQVRAIFVMALSATIRSWELIIFQFIFRYSSKQQWRWESEPCFDMKYFSILTEIN